MTRRNLLLFGLFVGAIVLGTYLLWPKPSAFTEENYGKIRVGMTLDEVEAILGNRAGNYGYNGQLIVQTQDDIDVTGLAQCRYLQWIDSRHMVGIQFGADRRVIGKDFGEVTPLPLWRRALGWLGL